ncbi:hypothetical protein [Burkholderia cenocepacia]|uniref:hypothetical protein n=1 Tax=Burkholderia cenocepacia TaxID=95486 RepID=UPI0015894266|nr:hypothetical protein [Burkholderia cenocepacia]
MTQPNEQNVVNNKLIIVTLIAGKAEASITVGPIGNPSYPQHVSIQPFLDAGLDEREALKRVMQIAAISVAGATR